MMGETKGKQTEVTRPLKWKGPAPSSHADFRKIEKNSDVGELTAVLASCPSDKKKEPGKFQDCMNNAAVVLSSWLWNAGFSADTLLKNAFEDDSGAYWARLTAASSDAFLPIIYASNDEKGRDLMLSEGYVSKKTIDLILAKKGISQ